MSRWFPTPALWFDRQDPANPFRSPRHRAARDLMLAICTRAAWGHMRHLAQGELELPIRRLADEAGLSLGATTRALEHLSQAGLVAVIRSSPLTRVRVLKWTEYGKAERATEPDGSKAMDREGKPRDAQPAAQDANYIMFGGKTLKGFQSAKSGTRPPLYVVPNLPMTSISCQMAEPPSETKRNTEDQSGTQAEQLITPSGACLKMQDDYEIAESGTESGTEAEEKRNTLYKELCLKTKKKNNPQTKERQGTPSSRASRRALEPSAFDQEIGKHWQEVTSRLRSRVPLKSQVEGATKLRETLGYTEAEIRDLLAFIAVTPFWIPNALSLLSLCERRKGVTKAETIFAQMLVAKEREAKAAAKQAPEKKFNYEDHYEYL
jgi:hypothetical protein